MSTIPSRPISHRLFGPFGHLFLAGLTMVFSNGRLLAADADTDGFDSSMDCNDNDSTIFPGATEVADGKDNDCDSLIDEGTDPDGDGVDSIAEDINQNGNPQDDDTDGDGTADYLDVDDDNDTVLSVSELPANRNTDGDNIVDRLDADDDNDGILTAFEDSNHDGEPTNDDTDDDSVPDFRDTSPSQVVHALLYAKGRAVSGQPAGTKFKSFGVPSINANGVTAFQATLINGSTLSQAVLAGSPAQVVAKEGGFVPGVSGALYAGFKDPVLSEQGQVAFHATISGGGATSATDEGIWAAGQLVAREGSVPAGIPGAKFQSFQSYALANDGLVAFTATLLPGAGGVGTTNDVGLWARSSSRNITYLIVRTGDLVKVGQANKTIKTLTVLSAVTKSPGQTRSFNDFHQLIYRVGFNDDSQAILSAQVP